VNGAGQKASIPDMTTDLIGGEDGLEPITPEGMSSTDAQLVDLEERLRRKTEELARWERRAEEQLRDEIEEREAFDRIAIELLAYIDRTERKKGEFRVEGAGPRMEEQLRADIAEREVFNRLAEEMLAHLKLMERSLRERDLAIAHLGNSHSAPSHLMKAVILARASAIVLYHHGPRALARRVSDWLTGKRGYYLRDITPMPRSGATRQAEPAVPLRNCLKTALRSERGGVP
jgi:hypothetical protein